MGLWSIVLPDIADTINYVTNPSAEVSTAGWYGIGGVTISQSTTDSFIGHACAKISCTSDAAANDGVLIAGRTSGNPVSGLHEYLASAYVKGIDGWAMRIALGTTDANASPSAYKDFTGSADWQKVWIYGTDPTAYGVVISINAGVTADFLVDGVMFLTNPRETIYIDGDQEDCHWYGQAGLSESYREENSRAGGQVYNIEDDLAVYVNSYTGIGQPTATHLTLSQPLIPGALYQGRKIDPRVISIEADFSGSSLESMHALRKTLMQYINPDLTDKAEVLLRYDGAGRPMYCRAIYDSGLEFGNPSGFDEVAPLRFIAYDPFFYDEGQSAIQMTGKATLLGPASGGTALFANTKGQWDYVRNPASTTAFGPSGSSIIINDISVNKYGEIWVGGDFAGLNGATDGANLSYFYNNTWFSGGLNCDTMITTICQASDGKMYIGGSFASIPSDSDFRYIGYLSDYPARSWNHMATGLDGVVNQIIEATDGTIYAVGAFNTTTDCYGFAKWNGTAFAAPTTSTLTSLGIDAIREGEDGKLYLGGSQIQSSDVAGKTGFAIFNPSSGLFETAISDTDSSAIYDVQVGADGAIYVGGLFGATTLGASGAVNVAKWNGVRFEPLGAPPDLGVVRRLFFDDNGMLWALGNFSIPTVYKNLDGIAMWNGYTWVHPDISTVSNDLMARSMAMSNGIRYLGLEEASANIDISTVTIATNTGQALAYPVFKCINSTTDTHRILYLQNNTTKKTIYLDYTIKPNEEVKISFIPGEKEATSSVFGNIWQSVLKGSDVGEFYLRPGDNRIVFFADTTGTTTLYGYLEWTNTYLSADEGA